MNCLRPFSNTLQTHSHRSSFCRVPRVVTGTLADPRRGLRPRLGSGYTRLPAAAEDGNNGGSGQFENLWMERLGSHRGVVAHAGPAGARRCPRDPATTCISPCGRHGRHHPQTRTWPITLSGHVTPSQPKNRNFQTPSTLTARMPVDTGTPKPQETGGPVHWFVGKF